MGFWKKFFHGEYDGADEETKEQWRQEMRESEVAKQFVEIIVREWFEDIQSIGCTNLRKQAKPDSYYWIRVHRDHLRFELHGDQRWDGRECKWKRIEDNDLGVYFSSVNMQDIENTVKQDTLEDMLLERLAQQSFLRVSGYIYYNEEAKLSW